MIARGPRGLRASQYNRIVWGDKILDSDWDQDSSAALFCEEIARKGRIGTYTIGEVSDVQLWCDPVPSYLQSDADESPLSRATKNERWRLGWERSQRKRQLAREAIADVEWLDEIERRIQSLAKTLQGHHEEA
jgi:hypothetical protein